MGAHRVLLVDGDRDSRFVFRTLLEYRGYEVLEAEDGELGAALALKQPPDLIVLELTLRHVDGVALVRRLKGDARTCEVPTVVVTARAMPDDERMAREAGCTRFLTKPIQPAELVSEIDALLGRSAERAKS